MKTYLIGVDAGTQGTKAGLYGTDGALLAAQFVPTHLIYRGDAIEQDPEELYASVLTAVRGAVEQAGVDPRHVSALAIDGQMAGILGVDHEGAATTPYDSWLDNRCGPCALRMKECEEEIIRLTGGCVSNHHGPKLLWWMEQQPDAWRRTRAFVTLSAYLSMRLSGRSEPYIDDTHLHFTGYADTIHRRWDEGLTHAFGPVGGKLPPILRSTECIGRLSSDAAQRMGLPAGIPVAAGCGDTAAAALGAGVIRPGMALDVAGTASVLAMSTDRYVPDTKRRTLLYMRSVLDGLFTPLAYIGGGGLCIRWVRDLLGKSYDALEEAARSVPPGSNGLQFLPHFAGRVCPASPYLSGAWYGLKWNHGPGEMYRSVLESIAAEYRTYHEILTDSAAIGPGGRVLGTGGGAKSALLCQLKADALQMTYHPLPHADTALWGSAVVAGITIGVYNKDGKDNPMPASEQAPFVPSGDREETWRRIAGRQARLTESMIRYAEEENKCRKEAGDLCS